MCREKRQSSILREAEEENEVFGEESNELAYSRRNEEGERRPNGMNGRTDINHELERLSEDYSKSRADCRRLVG